jgi:hypothetical protein
MVDVLEKAGFMHGLPQRSSAVRQASGWLHNRLRTAFKRSKLRESKHRNGQDYHDHRYPDISVDDVRERIARFRKRLDRFENVRVRKWSEHLFHIDA